MIQPQRIEALNDQPVRQGRYVLYWMQASPRAVGNHALEYAIRQANDLRQGVVVVFGLTDDYPEANLRHYTFLLEGLCDVRQALAQRGIQLVVRPASPPDAALSLADDASLLVTDVGYLRHQRAWRQTVAWKAPCRVVQVESNVIVPVHATSSKEEYAARTIRPKIHRLLARYLVPLRETRTGVDTLGLKFAGLDLHRPDDVLERLRIDRSVPPSPLFHGGTTQALRLLRQFIEHKLARYPQDRNQPALDGVSHMSPYLHFGQISPLQIALAVQNVRGPSAQAKDAFLEELIVRRELSMNFVTFQRQYDAYEAVPHWARIELKAHTKDPRPHLYSLEQFEAARTHDPYWNAAQEELRLTGKMHNYLRMYWGKKIIEWTAWPEEAFRIALMLNNKYSLDGRDPNSFAGIAWCFGKHDRPWARRPVFGSVRYMNAAGLERKCDMQAYVDKIRRVAAGGQG